MERSTMFHGKINYFDWVIFNSYFDITRGFKQEKWQFNRPKLGFNQQIDDCTMEYML